jgi:hypothetical protein
MANAGLSWPWVKVKIHRLLISMWSRRFLNSFAARQWQANGQHLKAWFKREGAERETKQPRCFWFFLHHSSLCAHFCWSLGGNQAICPPFVVGFRRERRRVEREGGHLNRP